MYSVSTNVIIVLDFQHFWEVLILLNEFAKLILPLICWLAIWCKLMSVCNWPLILITPVCVYQGPLACSMVWLIIKIKLVFFSYRYRTDWKYIRSINILEWNVFVDFQPEGTIVQVTYSLDSPHERQSIEGHNNTQCQ